MLNAFLRFLARLIKPQRRGSTDYYPDGTQRTYEGGKWNDDDAPHDRRGFGGM